MVGPTPVPAAQYATAATPRTSAETLLELQHELDVANDDHPAKRATWSPSQLGATTKAGRVRPKQHQHRLTRRRAANRERPVRPRAQSRRRSDDALVWK